jgi:hypothetical protein
LGEVFGEDFGTKNILAQWSFDVIVREVYGEDIVWVNREVLEKMSLVRITFVYMPLVSILLKRKPIRRISMVRIQYAGEVFGKQVSVKD